MNIELKTWYILKSSTCINFKNQAQIVFYKNCAIIYKDPINAERFEELIADLIEKNPHVMRVRLMGKTNEADGGRDILIKKRKNAYSDEKYLVIGQCKAYQTSVGKRDVTDIRDMLDHYDAEGFFLAASNKIRVSLIDYLRKLEEKYDVDWWTDREIFNRLRQDPFLADRYADIVEVVE